MSAPAPRMTHPVGAALAAQYRLVLGSTSPRRREILSTLGIDYAVASPDCDEDLDKAQYAAPDAYVLATARLKAAALQADAAQRAQAAAAQAARGTPTLVMTADTVVVMPPAARAAADAAVCGNALGILEKPRDAAHARAMLAALAGQTHEVLTALVVRQLPSPAGGADAELVATVTRTHVTFRPLAPDAIAAYVATGEPLDKAGAYGYQGLGACLVAGIHGCYYNVVGLSLSAVLDAFETILRSTPDATT